MACNTQTFSDLPVDHPACGAVLGLTLAGVVNGFPDGTFRPDQTVTRAEFAKMFILARSLAPRPDDSLPFSDTAGHWAAAQGYLQAAVADGAINGFPDGTFRPNDLVTRAQGVKIAVSGLPSPNQIVVPMMPTDVTADLWYYGSVEFAMIWRLMGPTAHYPVFTGVTFQGDTPMTRGEAAMLLANLLITEST